MKTKKYGFTLIELMGVISVLAIIAIIAIPIVEKNVKKGKEEANEIQIKNIKLATQNWVSDNKEEIINYFYNCEKEDPNIPCVTKILTLKSLIDAGYLDNETLKDFANDENINLEKSYIEITYISKNNYNYEVVLTNKLEV